MADLREGRPLVPYYDNQLEAVTEEIAGVNYLRVTGGGGGGGDATAANQLTQITIENEIAANTLATQLAAEAATVAIQGQYATLRVAKIAIGASINIPRSVVVFMITDAGIVVDASNFGIENFTDFEKGILVNSARVNSTFPPMQAQIISMLNSSTVIANRTDKILSLPTNGTFIYYFT